MKFPFQVITALEDATRNFEQLQISGIFADTALGGDLQGQLPNPTFSTQGQKKFLQTGGGKFSTVGTGTLTWPAASSLSNFLTVSLPGATGAVFAVATPSGGLSAGSGRGTITAISGTGSVSFEGRDVGGLNPGAGATMPFAYVMWGT